MNAENNKRMDRAAQLSAEGGEQGSLPFDRREWALMNSEAQDSLRRQYGREVRGHADD